MNIQDIKEIVDPAIQGIFESFKENNIIVKKTLLKKVIDEAITYNTSGKKSDSAFVSMLFSGRGRAWAKVDASKNLFAEIVNCLNSQNTVETTNLIDLFDQKGFAWMRFGSASTNHISFNLRHKGSKLEDSIVFNVSYDNMNEIENLEGVPHKLGLESGIFLNDKINKKELIEGDHTSISSNIISIEDLI